MNLVLRQVADDLAAEMRVLALDEFFVTDVADAVILHRLCARMWYKGVTLVRRNEAGATCQCHGPIASDIVMHCSGAAATFQQESRGIAAGVNLRSTRGCECSCLSLVVADWQQVSTSNRAPDALYEGGLQRVLFLPFIDRLKVLLLPLPESILQRRRFRLGTPHLYVQAVCFVPASIEVMCNLSPVFVPVYPGQNTSA